MVKCKEQELYFATTLFCVARGEMFAGVETYVVKDETYVAMLTK